MTIRVPMQFVSRCLRMIRPLPAPNALAAVTYSDSFSTSTWDRVIRAIPTQYKRAKTINMAMRLGPTFCIHSKPGFSARSMILGFRTMDSRMINKISGMVYKISVKRIIRSSMSPPAKPATAP